MAVLNSIEIVGLFGHYSYRIPLKAGTRKDICFLTGPNGYGKSTILELTYAFLKADAKRLVSIPFDSITFCLKDYRVVVEQVRSEVAGDGDDGSDNDDEQHETVSMTVTLYAAHEERLIERSSFADTEIDSVELPLFPPTLSVYLSSVNVEYIRDDRLLPKNADKLGVTSKVALLQDMMGKYDEHLSAMYNTALLDTIRKNKPADVDYEVLGEGEVTRRAMEKLEAYNKLGLATRLVDEDTSHDDRYFRLMQMVAVDEVLRYEDLFYQRLNLLYDIVDKAEFSDKQLVLDTRNGLFFVSGENIVIPEELSSGEQHYIVQAITLLMKAESDSLVLIDEPELSYHPAWQMDYLKNLKRIAEIGHYQFILATHSAQIFDYRWGYTVDLYKQTTDDAEGIETND